jgi:hypothetical protein
VVDEVGELDRFPSPDDVKVGELDGVLAGDVVEGLLQSLWSDELEAPMTLSTMGCSLPFAKA